MWITRRKSSRARISPLYAGVVCLLAVTLTGCNPTVSLYGIYVPGWLTAGIAGFVLSYLTVGVLARFAASRPLGESGVFSAAWGRFWLMSFGSLSSAAIEQVDSRCPSS